MLVYDDLLDDTHLFELDNRLKFALVIPFSL